MLADSLCCTCQHQQELEGTKSTRVFFVTFRTWYDLVWAFPRLSYKFNQRMVPTEKQLARTRGSSAGRAAVAGSKDVEAATGLASTDASEASACAGAGAATAAAAVRALQLVRLSMLCCLHAVLHC